MCLMCEEMDAMYRAYLCSHPAELAQLGEEEANYFGFRTDPATGRRVDAWPADKFSAEAIPPSDKRSAT